MFFSIAIAYYWRYLNIFRSLVARNNYKPKKYSMAKSGRVKLVTSLVLRGNAHTIPLIFTKIQNTIANIHTNVNTNIHPNIQYSYGNVLRQGPCARLVTLLVLRGGEEGECLGSFAQSDNPRR